MLPPKWRIQVHNESGTTVNVEIKHRGKKIASSGALEYAGAWSADLGTTGLANGAYYSTAEIDNEVDLFLASDLSVTLSTFGAVPDGNVTVLFQQRAEAAAEWPADGDGHPVIVKKVTAQQTYYLTGEV